MAGFEFVVSAQRVRHWAERNFGEGAEVAERIARTPWGYTINRQSRAFLDTGDIEHVLAGSAPFIVDGETGEIWSVGSSAAEYYGTTERPGYGALDDVPAFLRWRTSARMAIGNICDVDDPAGADIRMLARYAAALHGLRLPCRGPDEVGWNDMEVGFLVRPSEGRWGVCRWNRGTTEELASFSGRDDAIRMLTAIIARPEGWDHRGTPRTDPERIECGERDGREALLWDGHDATFAHRKGPCSRDAFLPFLRADLGDIMRSFHSADGYPLLRFDPLQDARDRRRREQQQGRR